MRARAARAGFALLVALATLALSVPLYTGFDSGSAAMQFVEDVPWIRPTTSSTTSAIDGISMALILLTTLTTVLVMVGAWDSVDRQGVPSTGGLPDPRRPDDRRVLRARRDPVLCVLRRHADPDVHHHRRLGRAAPRLRDR
jgi:hypothetical protein